MHSFATSCALLLLIAPNSSQAATLFVDAAGTAGPYTTIESAVLASSPGDTIDISAGTYVENSMWDIGHDLSFTSSSGGVLFRSADDNFNSGVEIEDNGYIFNFQPDWTRPTTTPAGWATSPSPPSRRG